MIARQEFLPAYIIHTRPYRDTSVLVDFFTESLGRVTAVARGVRQQKNRTRSLLTPFSRLLITLHGKQDLKLLTAVEADNRFFSLQANYLFSGFYVNELLLRSLPELDQHPELFAVYQTTLQHLHEQQPLEGVLRCFELALLADAGYGLDCENTLDTGDLIHADMPYLFLQHGFSAAAGYVPEEQCIPGRVIQAIARRDFSDPQVRVVAKKLCRQLLKPLLGSRPLHSRALFSSPAS